MDSHIYGSLPPWTMHHTLYWLNQTTSRGTQRGWHLERDSHIAFRGKETSVWLPDDETDSMLKTLERYQKCSYGAEEVNKPAKELESSYREYLKVKARFEALQRTQRNLLGEDLGPLNTKELEQLERQLESSLNQVRSTKTQYMLDQLADLQNKEHLLLEANRGLTIKLDEISARNSLRPSWEGDDQQNMSYGHQHAQSQGLFQALECNPTLQIGYNPVGSDQMTATTHATQQVHGFIPGWML
ncbi:hypothetical protein Peur_052740 [Populus x canadensis]